MIVTVKINEKVMLSFNVSDVNELQNVISSSDVACMMKNPINLISYLETNDPVFMGFMFKFLESSDEKEYRKNVDNYDLTLDTLTKYIAYTFGVPVSFVTVHNV